MKGLGYNILHNLVLKLILTMDYVTSGHHLGNNIINIVYIPRSKGFSYFIIAESFPVTQLLEKDNHMLREKFDTHAGAHITHKNIKFEHNFQGTSKIL